MACCGQLLAGLLMLSVSFSATNGKLSSGACTKRFSEKMDSFFLFHPLFAHAHSPTITHLFHACSCSGRHTCTWKQSHPRHWRTRRTNRCKHTASWCEFAAILNYVRVLLACSIGTCGFISIMHAIMGTLCKTTTVMISFVCVPAVWGNGLLRDQHDQLSKHPEEGRGGGQPYWSMRDVSLHREYIVSKLH